MSFVFLQLEISSGIDNQLIDVSHESNPQKQLNAPSS
jgi:hypothetical protein